MKTLRVVIAASVSCVFIGSRFIYAAALERPAQDVDVPVTRVHYIDEPVPEVGEKKEYKKLSSEEKAMKHAVSRWNVGERRKRYQRIRKFKVRNDIFPGMERDEKVVFEDPVISQQVKAYHEYVGKPEEEVKSKSAQQFSKEQIEKVKQTWMSFSGYMDAAMFDPVFGFYASGQVQLSRHKKKNISVSFSTYPYMMSPDFGAMIAYQAYGMWRSMLASNDLQASDPFTIIEFGAGEGILAHDVLHAIAANALQERRFKVGTHWSLFHEKVTYIIGERSPELRKRQEAKNIEFIKDNKLRIMAVDARDVEHFQKVRINGLILSNELLDILSVHKVLQMSDGSVKIALVMPTLDPSNLKMLSPSEEKMLLEKDKIHKELLQQLINDKQFDSIFAPMFPWYEEILAKRLILSADDWVAIKRKLAPDQAKSQAFDESIYFFELYIDSIYFPETYDYLQRHGRYLKFLGQSTAGKRGFPIWYMNYQAAGYIASVSKLLHKGFVVTIDYGNNSSLHHWQMNDPIQSFRLYPIPPRATARDVYMFPGMLDMTADVNFTDVAIVGLQNNLMTRFYGSQRALQSNWIQIGDDRSIVPFSLHNINFSGIVGKEVFEKFMQNGAFKMIIQSKVNNGNVYKIFDQSEILFPAIPELNQLRVR